MDSVHRQWMELSLAGDQVPVQPLTFTPPYLESVDVEISLHRKNDVTEISADDLTKHFVKVYGGAMFGLGEVFIFEYRGFIYRGTVKGLRVVELAAEQLRGAVGGRNDMGVMMERTDTTFMKGEGGGLKLKSSAKKYVSPSLKMCALKYGDLEPRRIPFWHPTSSLRTWELEVWILSSVPSSDVPSRLECSRLVWLTSSVSSTSRVSCYMDLQEQERL